MLFSQELGVLTTLHWLHQSISRYSTYVCHHSTDQQFSSSLIRTLILFPELTACKATLYMHMNIATTLLEQIKSCALNELFLTEEATSKQTVASILAYLCLHDSEGKPTPVDKLHLVLVFYLSLHCPMQGMFPFTSPIY